MSNSSLPVHVSLFDHTHDNLVQHMEATWGEFSQSLVAGHMVSEADKLSLPCFNTWRYKVPTDPTIDHGVDRNGQPLKQFTITHTRRIQPNLVEMTMLVLDFDGGMQIDEVIERFGEYEFVCYTSLNHQVNGVDKFRVVLVFAQPMPVERFRALKSAMRHWIEGDGLAVADPRTYSIGQVFLLPAVSAANQHAARAWRNEGALLDWRIFESISMPTENNLAYRNASPRSGTGVHQLLPDDVLQTSEGPVVVKSIDRKISRVLCPFHGDVDPSEFVAVSKSGVPYLVCKRCGTIYMTKEDPIIAGLKRFAKRKGEQSPSEGQ